MLIRKLSRESFATYMVQVTWSFAIRVGTLSQEDIRMLIGVEIRMSLGLRHDMYSQAREPYLGVVRNKTA